jgi:hypothetical protein
MANPIRELDDLLRGRKGRPELLAEGTGHLPAGLYATAAALLGALYGLAMALYAVLSRTPPVPEQLLASAVKVPALFFLTLLVTFPSLYVFSVLLGARFSLGSALRVVVCGVTVGLTVLASFAPITAFFTLTTASYHFMKLLSAVFFIAAGVIGLKFLLGMLRRLDEALAPDEAGPEVVEVEGEPGADGSPRLGGLLKVWVVIYALVGAQMAWILRPFIGTPHLPFAWFRPRGGNVFGDLLRTIGELFGP